MPLVFHHGLLEAGWASLPGQEIRHAPVHITGMVSLTSGGI
jgi:hypothetical protein